ncbi:MAG: DUF1273 family protein [Oscillospiraceae bacterium]|nr:DUF1273 family protein [Oscillospiraceae bacterium]
MEFGYCCFSGHRDIQPEAREKLELLLDKYIDKMVDCGRRYFLCGGALGFDTMAARAVLRAKMRCGDIKLALAIPYEGMEKHWSERDRQEFESILAQADSVHYIARDYDRDCMLRRDRYMVDHSEVCICYMTRNTGGTAYTVAQALKKGIEVVNLAMEI